VSGSDFGIIFIGYTHNKTTGKPNNLSLREQVNQTG
jgi:hypothetical protein